VVKNVVTKKFYKKNNERWFCRSCYINIPRKSLPGPLISNVVVDSDDSSCNCTQTSSTTTSQSFSFSTKSPPKFLAPLPKRSLSSSIPWRSVRYRIVRRVRAWLGWGTGGTEGLCWGCTFTSLLVSSMGPLVVLRNLFLGLGRRVERERRGKETKTRRRGKSENEMNARVWRNNRSNVENNAETLSWKKT